MPFVKVVPLAKCRPEAGTFVRHGALRLAVFRLTDPERVFVIDNECPHAGGSLSSGEVQGEAVTCPWHHWEFDLTTGACTHLPHAHVRSYEVQIRDGMVWVNLPGKRRSTRSKTTT